MRIGFDGKRALYNKSGLGSYSRNTIHALSTYQPNWELFVFRHSKKPMLPFTYESNVNFVTPHNAFYRRFGKLWRMQGISAALKKMPLDIYHGLSHELPLGIEKTGVKTVVTMHDVIFLRHPELFDASYRMIFRKKYAHACKVADRFIAITKQSKQDVMHYFKVPSDKIDVIYQDCSPLFHEKIPIEKVQQIRQKYALPETFILYVGTIEPRKNLLAVFKAIHRGNIDVPIVAVGRPTRYLDEVKAYVAKNGLENKAIFLHQVSNEELPAMYKAARLFVFPSMFEGLGLPIVEAMNVGIPVITTNGSCFPEIGGDAARYVNYGNTDEMIAAITDILLHDELHASMVEKGRKQAATFNEEDIVKDLVKVYQKVR